MDLSILKTEFGNSFAGAFEIFQLLLPFIRTILVIAVLYLIFAFLMAVLEKRLLKHAHNKNQITNVEVFSRFAKYLFLLLLVLAAIFTYTGSLTGLGLTFGLLSAAMGFALQKPITSIAAWLTIVFKKPFVIGDRIVINNVKGDVTDINLSHISLNEIGGFYGGEEKTGRVIMIPNHFIFDHSMFNYSYDNDYVLGQVDTMITYESNFDKAVRIFLEEASKRIQVYEKNAEFSKQTKPHVRVSLADSGVTILIRYPVLYKDMQQAQTDITSAIHKRVAKMKDIEIAYPHLEIMHRKKGL